jgi:Mg2+/Co2+ transporter CorC
MFDVSEQHLLEEILTKVISEVETEIDGDENTTYTKLSQSNTLKSLRRILTKVEKLNDHHTDF